MHLTINAFTCYFNFFSMVSHLSAGDNDEGCIDALASNSNHNHAARAVQNPGK